MQPNFFSMTEQKPDGQTSARQQQPPTVGGLRKLSLNSSQSMHAGQMLAMGQQ